MTMMPVLDGMIPECPDAVKPEHGQLCKACSECLHCATGPCSQTVTGHHMWLLSAQDQPTKWERKVLSARLAEVSVRRQGSVTYYTVGGDATVRVSDRFPDKPLCLRCENDSCFHVHRVKEFQRGAA